jgi:cation diffusion facilitator family transporter
MTTPSRSTYFQRERWALRFSAAGGLTLAIVAVIIGPLSHSSAVLFDGLYGLLGVGLSTFAAWISRAIEAGPTKRYPFGRDSLTPLIIVTEALIMLATSAVAVVVAIQTIVLRRGVVPNASALIYIILSVVISVLAWVMLRRVPSSDIVKAELWQWRASVALSLVMFVGILVAINNAPTLWAKDINSILVGVVSLGLLYPAARLMHKNVRELTESRPESELDERIAKTVATVARQHGLSLYELRTSKTGKTYVELEFVVPESYTVARADRVRKDLERKLRFVPDVWLTAEFTATPSFTPTQQ